MKIKVASFILSVLLTFGPIVQCKQLGKKYPPWVKELRKDAMEQMKEYIYNFIDNDIGDIIDDVKSGKVPPEDIPGKLSQYGIFLDAPGEEIASTIREKFNDNSNNLEKNAEHKGINENNEVKQSRKDKNERVQELEEIENIVKKMVSGGDSPKKDDLLSAVKEAAYKGDVDDPEKRKEMFDVVYNLMDNVKEKQTDKDAIGRLVDDNDIDMNKKEKQAFVKNGDLREMEKVSKVGMSDRNDIKDSSYYNSRNSDNVNKEETDKLEEIVKDSVKSDGDNQEHLKEKEDNHDGYDNERLEKKRDKDDKKDKDMEKEIDDDEVEELENVDLDEEEEDDVDEKDQNEQHQGDKLEALEKKLHEEQQEEDEQEEDNGEEQSEKQDKEFKDVNEKNLEKEEDEENEEKSTELKEDEDDRKDKSEEGDTKEKEIKHGENGNDKEEKEKEKKGKKKKDKEKKNKERKKKKKRKKKDDKKEKRKSSSDDNNKEEKMKIIDKIKKAFHRRRQRRNIGDSFDCEGEEETRSRTIPAVTYRGEDLLLPCDQCITGPQKAGVKWERKIKGKVKTITFDDNEDESKNRYILTPYNELMIKQIRLSEKGVYYCWTNSFKNSTYILNVKKPGKLHTVDLDAKEKPYAIKMRKDDEGLEEEYVYTIWGEWNRCSACNVAGERRRFGFCFIKLNHEEYFGSVPCGSAEAKRYDNKNSKRLDEVLVERCDITCSDAQKAYGILEKMNLLKELNLVKQRLKVHSGDNIRLKCLGTSVDDPVGWRNGSTELNLQEVRKGKGHLKITMAHALIIININKTDSGEYDCHVGGELRATYVLTVTDPLIDRKGLTASFYYMSSLFVVYFVMFVALMVMKHLHRLTVRKLKDDSKKRKERKKKARLKKKAKLKSKSTPAKPKIALPNV
ncbi:uncharacterized protein [Antedon mediterranea]|uniref:uncharacterized protein n=1 Tax=Antedon mediterranea TaxID=105859 RepID=UPI003AF93F26